MKLYLSSYRIPHIASLETILGKKLTETTIAFIPNAKDYYSRLAWEYKVKNYVNYFRSHGSKVVIVDLKDHTDGNALKSVLSKVDLIWAAGGNAFCLRYEMKRSKFQDVINELLAEGKVYGGDSAGAIVAGLSLKGVESADNPGLAQEILQDGLKLVPYVILPHADSPEFSDAVKITQSIHKHVNNIIELKNNQVAVFTNGEYDLISN